MIPKNNLDDRTFDDIVSEAIRLIPRYCPEWTNHNPTDPGITLVELFAWMTEMVLYRLNQVPEKIYLSLLELMGLSLIPPQSARAVIRFFPVEGYKKTIRVKGGTQVAAIVGNDDAYMFETEQDVSISSAKLEACINRTGEKWTNYCEERELKQFKLFETNNYVEHLLYLASPSFAHLASEHTIQISFVSGTEIASAKDELINFLYWEYWDGRSWTRISPQRTLEKKRKKDNVIYFSGPVPIEACTVNDQEGFFLRATLSRVPERKSTLQIQDIELQTYFGGSGFTPDLCISNFGSQYQPIDINNTFRIFSENPSYNEAFYLAADEVLSRPGNKVTIIFTFSEVYVSGNENENVKFSYEYWDGDNWKRLGESPRDASEANPSGFKDGTFAFKQSGEIQFTVPKGLVPAIINNEEHYWLRMRLVTKDFSIGGSYIQDENANWVWQFSSKVHSPLFSKVRITYNMGIQRPLALFSQSNFNWKDLKGGLGERKDDEEKTDFNLFDISQDTLPALYLGFSAPFAKGNTSIYVKINDEHSPRPKAERFSFFNEGLLPRVPEKRLIDLSWEYWNGNKWAELAVNDYTDSFHESGFIDFVTPPDMAEKNEFAKKLYWLRFRLVSGGFEAQPAIMAIFSNAVYAQNKTSYRNEIVGSGTGAPAQSFSLVHGPLLPGIEIYVDEGSIPPSNEIDIMLGEGVKEPYKIEGESVWVRYKEVNDFYSSTPLSRHFIVDYREQKIHFGDGERGINPPRRKFSIRIASYNTGGGAAGNVAAGTLRTLTQSIAFIAGCDNPFPAEGGADMETVDSLKSRAAGVFKSLQRAVTAEDFQWLSREASASVGRAWCLKEKNKQGEIVIVIIPVIPTGETLACKLVPSRELVRRVTGYLEERKLVGTKIRVQGPVYRVFHIKLTLVFRSDILDVERLKKNIETTLRSFCHVLAGGDGEGWEFGKSVTAGAVLKQLEKVQGILSVDEVQLFDADTKVAVEKLVVKDDEIPYLEDIQIENRRAVE
ncbi:MAG: putative baseplate assembly protein [Treponema sp.]|nr:putative baseplate assembly protein [Treponema sp.]